MTIKRDAAPAGEQIHLPGDSLAPLGVAFGITLIFLGLFTTWIIAAVGLVVALLPLRSWMRTARAEAAELPLGINR